MPHAFDHRDISDDDFRTIRARMLPHLQRKGKQRPKADVLEFLAHLWPLRLEFEMLRLKGLAFDAGEAGFTYTKGE